MGEKIQKQVEAAVVHVKKAGVSSQDAIAEGVELEEQLRNIEDSSLDGAVDTVCLLDYK